MPTIEARALKMASLSSKAERETEGKNRKGRGRNPQRKEET